MIHYRECLCDGMVDVPVLGTGVLDVSVRVRPKAPSKAEPVESPFILTRPRVA